MSVREPDRKPSTFEVRDNVKKLSNQLIVLVYSNFGIDVKEETDAVGKWAKHAGREIELSATVQTNRPDISGASLILEFERDGLVYLKTYKTWLVSHYKEEIWKYAQELSYHIRVANTINPILVREYEERRLHQDQALSCCLHLLDLIEQTKDILHVKLSKLTPIIELLHSERRLIKAWRRSDYSKLQGCLKREDKLRLQALDSLKKDYSKAIRKKAELQEPGICSLLSVLEDTAQEIRREAIATAELASNEKPSHN